MTKELMKQSLEALQGLIPMVHDWYSSNLHNAYQAIGALEEALNQEQDEPETLNYTVSVECKRCGSHEKYDLEVDYPPPHQRTWIGLLHDEKEHIEISGGKADLTLAEKIEAILKERNT